MERPPHWWADAPTWFNALHGAPALAGLPLSWLSEPVSAARARALHERRVPAAPPGFTADDHALVARALPLAAWHGAAPPDEAPEGAVPQVVVDRARPGDGLWVVPAPSVPPWRWLPAGTSYDGLARALGVLGSERAGVPGVAAHEDLWLLGALRALAQGEDLMARRGVISVASRCGYALLLHELWAAERDPGLREHLARVAEHAEAPPTEAALREGPPCAHLVLRADVERAVVERWVAARALRLDLAAGEPFTRVWSAHDGSRLAYQEDPRLGQAVLQASGPQGAEWAGALRAQLPHWTRDTCLRAAVEATGPAERASSLVPVIWHARGCVRSDMAVVDLLRARLRDENPAVRRAALLAARDLDWPTLEPLMRAAESDPLLAAGARRWREEHPGTP